MRPNRPYKLSQKKETVFAIIGLLARRYIKYYVFFARRIGNCQAIMAIFKIAMQAIYYVVFHVVFRAPYWELRRLMVRKQYLAQFRGICAGPRF